MTEDQLLHNVLDLCALLHLRTAHFRPARTERGWRTPVQGDGKGFPDLVICGHGRMAFRELKSAKGALTLEQAAWLQALRLAGQSAEVWRPEQWASGEIEKELKALAKGHTHA